MAEKFDPAPFDKYADTPAERAKADGEIKSKLNAGLIGTFPASDPVSEVQPSPSIQDSGSSGSLWQRLTSLFK